MPESAETKDLAAALAKAQGAIEGAKKDSVNPHFKQSYADMASVREACQKPLADNNLSIIQMSRYDGGEMRLATRVMHSSGQWIEDDGIPLLLGKKDMQGLGSALTYARRYGMMAALGIAPEDDDGEGAVKGSGKATPVQGGNAKARWHGPMNKTELQKAMRAFGQELRDVADEAELANLMGENRSVLDQCQLDLPTWWFGDGQDITGAFGTIEQKRAELKDANKYAGELT